MIPQFTRATSPVIPIAAALLLLPGLALSAPIPNIAPEIVSAWKSSNSDTLLIFRYDGVYFQVQDDSSAPGMERGTFTWDKATSAFSATTLRDTNGESGLSHPAGTTTVSISGNTLTYNVVSEGSLTFSRVTNSASAIVGSWFIPGDPSTVTFLAGSISGNISTGIYYSTEEEDDAPFGYDGMERGTYTWNSSTKILTANAATDTNGDIGLSSLSTGFTATIVGNSLTAPDGVGTTVFRRITQIPTLLNVAPDFEVDKFSNYRQTSPTNPALLAFPLPPEGGDLPFFGEAYINDTISGTGGSLTIAGQAARPFVNDGGWSIADEYSSLTLLNASTAFPNGVTYTFARPGGIAELTYPANGTFPTAPKIVGADENGAWSGGQYFLGQDPTLIWNAHAGYDPGTLVTVLSVVDQNSGEEILYETVFQGDITSYDFRGRLAPRGAYDVQLEHIKIASSTTAGTGPFSGKFGYALYNSNTRFTMIAPDEPVLEPVITQQPVSQLPAEAAEVILTVATSGEDHTLTYQWFKNDAPIPGQTGNSLFIRNYSSTVDGGTYTIEVSNAAGSDTSNPAILGSPTVESITLSKDIEYIQTGPSTVIVNPEGITATHGGTYGFFTEVKGNSLALITAPVVTPPAGTSSFQNILRYNSGNLLWGYGVNGDEFNTDTQALIDSKFPNGTYTFHVNGVSIPLILPGNTYYPNTPEFTLSGGTWVNGKYAIDAANSMTITTNVFAQYRSNADGRIRLRINDELKQEMLASSNPTSDFTSYTVPPSTFRISEINEIHLDFDAITSKSNAIPGAFTAAYYTKSLFTDVHILPKITSQSSSLVVLPSTSVDLQVSATGSPAAGSVSLDYQWKKNGIIIPGLTGASFGILGFNSDNAGTYTCVVSNDVGNVTTQPIHLEFADGFQTYAASFGLNSVTSGAPDADFDNDNIPNLLEYLLGGNPRLPSSGLLPAITKAPSSNNLVFTYKRKIAATGVIQVIEHATTLSPPWTPAVHGQSGVTIATAPVPSDPTAEQVTVTIPSTSVNRFVRLKAGR